LFFVIVHVEEGGGLDAFGDRHERRSIVVSREPPQGLAVRIVRQPQLEAGARAAGR
jgi:hypothetical protein